MSTDLTTKAMSNTEMIIHNFTEAELETLKKTIAKGTTNEQFALFVATCKRSKLDPFLNQIHCIVYVGQSGPVMSIQFPVEGYVADAKRNPEYRGYKAAVVKENDLFEADMSESTYVHRMVGLNNPGKTVGAYCKVFREGRPDVLVIVTVDQLQKHIAKSKNKDTIDTWYDDFVIKHAVKRAFRIQFGIDFSDEDDGGNSTDAPNDSYKRKDITDEANAINGEPKKLPEQKKDEEPKLTEVQQREAAYQKMLSNFELLGITKDDQGDYVTERVTMVGKKLTLNEFSALLKIMDQEIQAKENANDELED